MLHVTLSQFKKKFSVNEKGCVKKKGESFNLPKVFFKYARVLILH